MRRTLTDLRRSPDGGVCILLRDAKTGERFLRDAQGEGVTIGGGKPTAHPYAQVMALHDGTITYVGA